MSDFIDPKLVPKLKLYSGDEIPCIGMGTFGNDRYTPEQVSAAVAGAIRCGYRFFDCAAAYGNEEEIGRVFEEAFREGIVRREEMFIESKVWNNMHGRGDVLISLAKTLKDLRLDYVDAFYVHWPFPNHHALGATADSRSPDAVPFSTDRFMATWRQMERIHDLGLAKNIAMSNMTIPKLEAVLPLCRVKPALIQAELHPCFQQPELFDYCVGRGIIPVGFCPIGSPIRPERDTTPDDIVVIEVPELVEIAKAHNAHPAVICVKWAARRGHIPIPFTVHENEYVINLRCVTEDPLTDAEMAALKSIDKNHRLIKGPVFLWEGAKGWEDLWDMYGTIAE